MENRLDATERLHHETRVMRDLLPSVLPNAAAAVISSVVSSSSQGADPTVTTSRQDVAPVASMCRSSGRDFGGVYELAGRDSRRGGGGRRGQMPQAALFLGRHFGEIVLLKQHSYIVIRGGLHEF